MHAQAQLHPEASVQAQLVPRKLWFWFKPMAQTQMHLDTLEAQLES